MKPSLSESGLGKTPARKRGLLNCGDFFGRSQKISDFEIGPPSEKDWAKKKLK